MLAGTAHASNRITQNYRKARDIIYLVFPPQTAGVMLKIAGCETGEVYNANAENASGASGYFQVLSSHNGTTYSYGGISVTVDSSRLFDPHYNALVAYVMSDGGRDLSPWTASEFCWN